MWVEELELENIKCFENISLKFGDKNKPYKWITLLGENGGGKSTVLQALGLMLTGHEGAQKLFLNNSHGWLRNESKPGKISVRIHQDENDIGDFGNEKKSTSFGYTFSVVGSKEITIGNKTYTEPSLVENSNKIYSWLRKNAFSSKGTTWFSAGYGAFRRLTRSSQIIVPSLQTSERFQNFIAQFDEDKPLALFEQWIVYLDYRIAKDGDENAKRLKELGIKVINKMLPEGNSFSEVTSDGRILFNVKGKKVPTIGLSDGFRSILALAGDLVWRLFEAFPDSENPLHEKGTVLIDELDIHLHPAWQRNIAGWLQTQFPNLQFIVATHSPLIAAGAGSDAVTYKLDFDGKQSIKTEINDTAFMSVDDILQSPAFQLVSPYSIETERQIQKYISLQSKKNRTVQEENELQQSLPFAEKANRLLPDEDSLDYKIQEFLKEKLK